MELSAKDLRVLVTAGGSGIGRVIAETFAKAGARVHISDIEEKFLAETKRRVPQVSQTLGDVAKPADVERLFQDVQRSLGGLDVLVNNAGIAGPTAKVEDIRPEDWERTIAVDVNGMFYCTRKAMPLLKAAGGGSIINLSSIAGRLGFPMRTPYSAAKWAVVGFTQSLAAEAGPDGVRVNCIQPGIVEGERVERIVSAKAQALGVSADEVLEKMVEGVSLKTTVTAQDVANTALFLASDAGKHISGQAISVCGGVRYLV
ncbi:MAG TPA: SDR family oxidoreductase [Burkholderiales bacterium]|jgi:NAD(P)-dependent dehydrogenase (short-subunit alcohol dehydrogenase family)|nr:SDR family oxidoreductase [Burkholderiales bacterium]